MTKLLTSSSRQGETPTEYLEDPTGNNFEWDCAAFVEAHLQVECWNGGNQMYGLFLETAVAVSSGFHDLRYRGERWDAV